MKIGKVSESVLKRSVLKQVHSRKDEILCGTGVGVDCAIFALNSTDNMTTSMQESVILHTEDIKRVVTKAANNVACAGGTPFAIMLTLLLPETTEEPEIKNIMAEAEKVSKELEIQIAGGHTTVSSYIEKPRMSVTAIGRVDKDRMVGFGKARPGQDIVVSKWIGLEGTSLLAASGARKLAEKYPQHLVETAISFKDYISILPEAATAVWSNVSAMHDVSEGGIFRALWELAESTGVGLTIDLKKLPIRQETVEVCEFFNVNPYELLSGGSLIMTVDDGFDLVKVLEQKQISAAVVGKITNSNDRIVINEDEHRFLDRPKSDEIYKILNL